MATIANVLRWDHSSLTMAAEALLKRRQALIDMQDELDGSVPPPTWLGDSGEAARAKHKRMSARLLDMTAEVADVVLALDEAASSVEHVLRELQGALDEASTAGLEVNHATGVVTDPRHYDDASELAEATASVDRITDRVRQALKNADEADRLLAGALKAAAQHQVDGGSGTLLDAASHQLPPGLDGLTPEQLAEKLGDGIAVDVISAYLNVDGDLATWEIEGAAKAEYKVMLDGSVVMSLHLEAGLGKGIEVPGASASATAGLTSDLDLRFGNKEEAQKFLEGFDNAAFDLEWRDAFTPGPAVLANVAGYVMDQEIDSFRVGAYGKIEGSVDSPAIRAAAEGRIDGQWDVVNKAVVLKATGSHDWEVGPEEDPTAALAANASVQMTLATREGDTSVLEMNASVSGDVATRALGIPMSLPTTTGGGGDVQVTMKSDNPAWPKVEEAAARGDFDQARQIAIEHGRVVYRAYGEQKLDLPEFHLDIKAASVDVDTGGSIQNANQIWIRAEGSGQYVRLGPEELR